VWITAAAVILGFTEDLEKTRVSLKDYKLEIGISVFELVLLLRPSPREEVYLKWFPYYWNIFLNKI
jgi:hypothetical protein